MFSGCVTFKDGSKRYFDQFINKSVDVTATEKTGKKITIPANSVCLIFPKNIDRPFASINIKGDNVVLRSPSKSAPATPVADSADLPY